MNPSHTDEGSQGPLTAAQVEALYNLARKQAGHDVGWVNISAGRALTELGFARRSAGGWSITPEGVLTLAEQPPVAAETIALPARRLRLAD